jgi:hypothetical protein
MRRTPTLHFHYDEGLDQSRRVDSLIAQALERDREIHEQGSADELASQSESVEEDGQGDEDFEADVESGSDETLER